MSSSPIALAFWGFIGAFAYAASRVITVVLGDNEISRKAVWRAWAQFVVAILFGTAAAVAFGPMIMVRVGPAATSWAVAFATGLSINWAWPILVDVMVPWLRRAARAVLAEMNSNPSGGEPK